MVARINQMSTLCTTCMSVVVDSRWYEQCRRLISSGPNTIGFLWRTELIKHPHSPQHCPLVESIDRLVVVENRWWYEQFRLSNLLVLITIGFQCSINWFENRNCAQHLCNGEQWLLIISGPKHMCFQWCRELFKRRRSPQHTSPLVSSTGEEVRSTMIWTVSALEPFSAHHHRISMEH
jgi:hypothetical protein